MSEYRDKVCNLSVYLEGGLDMLKVTFKDPGDSVRDTQRVFEDNYSSEWLHDQQVQQIIKEINHATVSGEKIIGQYGEIEPERLSHGVQALILMLKTDRIIWGTACGDNCADWINKISRMKDITLFYEHPMEFKCELNGVCIDTNKPIHNNDDFMRCYLESKGFEF